MCDVLQGHILLQRRPGAPLQQTNPRVTSQDTAQGFWDHAGQDTFVGASTTVEAGGLKLGGRTPESRLYLVTGCCQLPVRNTGFLHNGVRSCPAATWEGFWHESCPSRLGND